LSTPAGWYDDPNQPGQQQYWDGNAWTGQMQSAPAAAATIPPPPVQDPYGTPPANPYAPPANPYGGPPPIGGYPGQAFGPAVGLPPAVAGRALAGWWSRVGASLIDALFSITIIGYFVNWFLMGRDGERNGQTLGKQVVGIRVVKADGTPVSVGFGILREFVVKGLVFGTAGWFLFGIPGLLNYLWPLWDKPGQQALHDKIVSTYVTLA
jgi:uncharacterized RDD family membrane protein YckC